MTLRLFSLPLVALAFTSPQGLSPPLVDHHQHLFSPAATKGSKIPPIDASSLVSLLDAADIRRAVVLSLAYQFGNPNKPPVENEYDQVKAENDWTSQQVARFRIGCGDSAASTR